MKRLIPLTILLFTVLLTSGCTDKLVYVPCPEYEPVTQPPILDLNGTGKMIRLPMNRWSVTDAQVHRVLEFEKSCYEREADYVSTLKAVNVYNESLGAK